MSGSPAAQAKALRLHQRLLEGDRTATADLADAYLVPLIDWLCATYPGIDPALSSDAAGDAILALTRNPQSYDPGRLDLEAYLRMSARGDLRNRQACGLVPAGEKIPLERVELSPGARNYPGRDVDPSPLEAAERDEQAARAARAAAAVLESVRQGLNDPDRRVLELLLREEHSTAPYAEAMGITHLPPAEQTRQVKRAKGRVKKRVERAGGGR